MLRSVPMSDAQVVAPFTTFGKGMLSNKLSLLPPEQKQRHLTARAILLIAERPAAHSDCAQQHGERAGKLGLSGRLLTPDRGCSVHQHERQHHATVLAATEETFWQNLSCNLRRLKLETRAVLPQSKTRAPLQLQPWVGLCWKPRTGRASELGAWQGCHAHGPNSAPSEALEAEVQMVNLHWASVKRLHQHLVTWPSGHNQHQTTGNVWKPVNLGRSICIQGFYRSGRCQTPSP